MKAIILITTLLTFNSYANESIIQLLEKNNVSTETFVTTGTAKKHDGSQLKSAIQGMLKRLAFAQYATVDHKSKSGVCLEQGIVSMFKNPEEFDPSVFVHCGGIFDEESFNNGDDDIQHQKQHQLNVTLVKQLAFEDCNQGNQVAQFPVFTAPQDLVNIIYNLNSQLHSEFHLSEGVSYHCTRQRGVLTHTTN